MSHMNVDEMTFDEIVGAAQSHAKTISSMLNRADPHTAADVLLQLQEIEGEIAAALYSDLLAMVKEHEDELEVLIPL